MTDYLRVIGDCFPNAQAYVNGNDDPTVYSNIQWLTTPISQATLDSADCPVPLFLTDLELDQIIGAVGQLSEHLLFSPDVTRSNKKLSVESSVFRFEEFELHERDWLIFGEVSNSLTGIIVPYDCTVVRSTMHVRTCGSTLDINLVIDNIDNGSILTVSSGSDLTSYNTDINIDVNAGQKLRLQSHLSGPALDVVINLWIKWRKD